MMLIRGYFRYASVTLLNQPIKSRVSSVLLYSSKQEDLTPVKQEDTHHSSSTIDESSKKRPSRHLFFQFWFLLGFGSFLVFYQKLQKNEEIHPRGNKGIPLEDVAVKLKTELLRPFRSEKLELEDFGSIPFFVNEARLLPYSFRFRIQIEIMRLVNFMLKRIFNPVQCETRSSNTFTPGNVSPALTVPLHIARPSYVDGRVPYRHSAIDLKSDEEISSMRETGRLAQRALATAKAVVKPGVTTDDIDKAVHAEIVANDAYPSPLFYDGFPKSCCTSVNNVVCHGIPDDRKLRSGDIINVDVSVFRDGFHADTSDTFAVGSLDPCACRLIDATHDCLHRAIIACKPEVPFSFIGEIIEDVATNAGFSICRRFIGHGIGRYFHGPPDVYHYRSANAVKRPMLPGMTFTIEPILMERSHEVDVLSDGWTVVSRDSGRSAQAEHTILITNNGCEVLT